LGSSSFIPTLTKLVAPLLSFTSKNLGGLGLPAGWSMANPWDISLLSPGMAWLALDFGAEELSD
jgi:hypothetical protein